MIYIYIYIYTHRRHQPHVLHHGEPAELRGEAARRGGQAGVRQDYTITVLLLCYYYTKLYYTKLYYTYYTLL